MNVLDLFSGIGGFSLGLERAGMRTVAFCEIDPFCRKVLAKHWPDVPCYDDVRTLTADRLRSDGVGPIDAICGGFPCQDISLAGRGAGLAGERSGLWFEYARIIGELRPRFVVVENVAALLGRGLDRVLGDLAAFGYDAEWHCIPASAVGAPHRRDRLWIIAHATGEQMGRTGQPRINRRLGSPAADAGGEGLERLSQRREADRAHDDDPRREPGGTPPSPTFADAISRQLAQCWPARRMGREEPFSVNGPWPITSEPFVRRGDHGISDRPHRLRALGNAVVPQIPEIIGRAIMTQAVSSEERGPAK